LPSIAAAARPRLRRDKESTLVDAFHKLLFGIILHAPDGASIGSGAIACIGVMSSNGTATIL
jgi:hypothetical protein